MPPESDKTPAPTKFLVTDATSLDILAPPSNSAVASKMDHDSKWWIVGRISKKKKK
jgi:hypothetical protein